MSAREDQSGSIEKVYSHSVQELLAVDLPKPKMVLEEIFQIGHVNQILVEPGVDVRRLFIHIACSVTSGSDFFSFKSNGPKKLWAFSASADAYSEMQRLRQHLQTLTDVQRALVNDNLLIYQRSFERDGPLGIEAKEGRDAFELSRPPGWDIVLIDNVRDLYGHRWDRHDRKDVEYWLRSYAQNAATVIYFDESSRPARSFREIDSLNTISIAHDPNAQTEFGGGFLLTRHRDDEVDHLPKTISCSYIWVDGKLTWEHSLPGDAERNSKKMRALALQLKIVIMKLHGANGVQTALFLKSNETAICRALKKFEALTETAAALMVEQAEAATTEAERAEIVSFLQEHRSGKH
jgi:hypothetical protein